MLTEDTQLAFPATVRSLLTGIVTENRRAFHARM